MTQQLEYFTNDTLIDMFTALLRQSDMEVENVTDPRYPDSLQFSVPIKGNIKPNPIELRVQFNRNSVGTWRMNMHWKLPEDNVFHPVPYLITAGKFAEKLREVAMEAWMYANRSKQVMRFQDPDNGGIFWYANFPNISGLMKNRDYDPFEWMAENTLVDNVTYDMAGYTMTYFAKEKEN